MAKTNYTSALREVEDNGRQHSSERERGYTQQQPKRMNTKAYDYITETSNEPY